MQQIPTANEPVSFTRHLYETTEVAHSLLFALLDRNRDEALFWAMELVYSGLEDTLVEWIRWLFVAFYESANPKLSFHVYRQLESVGESTPDLVLGEIVANLAHRPYHIREFVNRYSMDRTNSENGYQGRGGVSMQLRAGGITTRIWIRLKPSDLDIYRMTRVLLPARNHLAAVSRFPIRKSESLFLRKVCRLDSEIANYTAEDYWDRWLYFAIKTPVWARRIEPYTTFRADHATKTVKFAENDTGDTELEDFYEKYGYEPDEQKSAIHRIHGICVEEGQAFRPMTETEFLEKYRYE